MDRYYILILATFMAQLCILFAINLKVREHPHWQDRFQESNPLWKRLEPHVNLKTYYPISLIVFGSVFMGLGFNAFWEESGLMAFTVLNLITPFIIRNDLSVLKELKSK